MDRREKSRTAPDSDVIVVEVGPRDGLQNEPIHVPTATKVAFVDELSRSGLRRIEVTSFVNPKLVPQLADAEALMADIERAPDVRYSALVPNERGLHRAIAARVDAIAVFTSATDAFARENVGASIDETFERFASVMTLAAEHGIPVRGYISVAFGCPFSGEVRSPAVVDVAERLIAIGCDEICLADTIGVAKSASVRDVVRAVQRSVPSERLAVHFHDTAGRALLNVEAALDEGIRVFDSAAGGLGGCPFAPGAPGNLATERLVARLEHLGFRTGIDADVVANAVDLLSARTPGCQGSRV